jgi:hypothetical protein
MSTEGPVSDTTPSRSSVGRIGYSEAIPVSDTTPRSEDEERLIADLRDAAEFWSAPLISSALPELLTRAADHIEGADRA